MCMSECVCIYSLVSVHRVNAGSPCNHLINYLEVVWLGARSCLGACWSESWCSSTICQTVAEWTQPDIEVLGPDSQNITYEKNVRFLRVKKQEVHKCNSSKCSLEFIVFLGKIFLRKEVPKNFVNILCCIDISDRLIYWFQAHVTGMIGFGPL